MQVRKRSKEITSQTCAHQESSLSRNLKTCCGVNSSFKLLILYSEQWIKLSICATSTTNRGLFGFFHPLSCELCISILKRLMPFTRFGCSRSPTPRALPGPALPPRGSICDSSQPFIMKCTKMTWNKNQNIPKSYLPQLNYFKCCEPTWSRANYWIFVYYFLYKKSSSYTLGRQLQPINSVFVF